MILSLESLGDSGLDLKVNSLNLDKLIHIVFDPNDLQDIYGIVAFELMIPPQPQ